MTRKEMQDRLVDYAVGEVSPGDRTEIEQELEKDGELRAELERIREAIGLVSASAPEKTGLKLTPARREELMAAAVRGVAPAPSRRRWTGALGLAAAGLLGMVVGAGVFKVALDGSAENAKRVAKVESPESAREAALRADFNKMKGDYTALVAEQQKLQANNNPQGTAATYGPATLPSAPIDGLLQDRAKRKEAGGRYAEEKLRRRVPQGKNAGFVAGEMDHNESDGFNTEEYSRIMDNPFLRPLADPLSTFSIDVDTAAYANARRFITGGQLPPADAVRIEEMVNYFHYDYARPAGNEPFAVNMEVQAAPWEPKHRLVRIGLQGREIEMKEAPSSNLVFLIDVSGSMNQENKLPLVKQAMRLLVERLRANDRVSLVVYAGAAGVVLPSTSGTEQKTILAAIDNLAAGGSTNGGQGIELAYRIATENFVKGGINRVLLCTDGDFNVGVSSEGGLVRLIEDKRQTGVFLSVLGFGTGNYADARMQQLADKGNGNASYIDSLNEARKVLVEQMTGTLLTIAKDVKIQVEFNPSKVAAYRLIGYENRLLAAQDFNDDKKDAGEIGAGHQVTALYEIIPAGGDVPASDIDPLKYQAPGGQPGAAVNELLTVKLRYKAPDGDVSTKIETSLPDAVGGAASPDFEFAASVAAFGMLLRDSEHKGQTNWGLVQELATGGLGNDPMGHRAEFVELIKKARTIAGK